VVRNVKVDGARSVEPHPLGHRGDATEILDALHAWQSDHCRSEPDHKLQDGKRQALQVPGRQLGVCDIPGLDNAQVCVLRADIDALMHSAKLRKELHTNIGHIVIWPLCAGSDAASAAHLQDLVIIHDLDHIGHGSS